MLDKKVTKEITNLLTSSDKAKKAISIEIEKIDAKYKALAEKEKSKLSDMLKSIEKQMESYKALLGLNDEIVDEVEEVENPVEEEEKVVDNLFPENNDDPVAEVTDEQVVEEEAVNEENVVVTDNAGETVEEWPTETVESEKKDDDEDEWPAFPQEWGK